MATSKKPVINVPVNYGGVSIGESTARLGINIDRENLGIDRADDAFCNRRLLGCVVLGHAEEDAAQLKLIDGTDHIVRGSFDVKGFRVATDKIGTGLTFSLNDIDVGELAKFSKGSGRLLINEVADIPDDDKADSGHVPGTLRTEGPWRDVLLDTLFTPGQVIRKSLAAAGLETVGDMSDYSESGKQLTDIPGLGPNKAEVVEERLIEFYADNPDMADQAST